METLVATVLIVIVFMTASMLLNTLFLSGMQGNSRVAEERITELQYVFGHGGLELPYEEDWGDWKIEVKQNDGPSGNKVVFKAWLKDDPGRIHKNIAYGASEK